MRNPQEFIKKAQRSRFYLWMLNAYLPYLVPFNKPHGLKIVSITDHSVRTCLPYKKRNLNHIKGLHACALATISEFTVGFSLLRNLPADQYRLIMQKMEIEYHFQGKSDAYAEFSAKEEWLQENFIDPLRNQDSVVVPCKVNIHDQSQNHLTTATVYWQVKKWARVKTKM